MEIPIYAVHRRAMRDETFNFLTSGYAYDTAGNMTTAPGAGNLVYDAENHLLSTSGGGLVTYTYDGDGRRVQKSSGTLYWYDPSGDVLLETNASGGNLASYIFLNGKRVGRWTSGVDWYATDHLGTSRYVFAGGTNGQNVSDFYPFGGERVIQSQFTNTYKFTGKERDSESGLDEFGARYYSSAIGRFTIPDWAANAVEVPYSDFGNPQSLNLYSYAENNPITFDDPDGHDPDVNFETPELEAQYNKIASESPIFAKELQAEKDDHNTQVNVVKRGFKENDEKSKADTTFVFKADGTVTATVSVDNAFPRDKDIEHETGHVKDARENKDQFLKDAKKSQDKNSPNRLPHNDRPEEKRADKFKDQVERERKALHDEQKREKKERKKREKEVRRTNEN